MESETSKTSHDFVKELEVNSDGFDLQDKSLYAALRFLEDDEILETLGKFDGADDSAALRKDKKDILDEFIKEEKNEKTGTEDLGFEAKAKRNGKPWRVVIDFPVEPVEDKDNTYKYKAPVIQFCSGSPKYNRYVLSFKKSGVKDKVVIDCIKIPTQDELQNVVSGVKDSGSKDLSKGGPNLKQVKEFYDNAGIQRIAILGAARIFPDTAKLNKLAKKNDSLNLEEQQQLKDLQWAEKYTDRVKKEVNVFFKYLDEEAGLIKFPNSRKTINKKVQYTTVNGGWAGIQEKGEGVPKMASELGLMHSKKDAKAVEEKDYGYYPPITIMPHGGNHDRVKTIADIKKELRDYVSDRVLENFEHAIGLEDKGIVPEDKDKKLNESTISNVTDAIGAAADATYFEIPGVWGDDSRYLVGMSTSLLVFDPHDLWTDIEIANGIAQGKSIAIIADPDKLEKYGDFNEQGFVQKEGYRVYNEACNAAKWINEEWGDKILLQKSVSEQSWMQSQKKILGRKRTEGISTESKSEKPTSENPDSRSRSVTI